MNKDEMDFKGVFIPAPLWFHTELSWSGRILLIQIFYLSKTGKGCFASNSTLAKFLGLSESYVRNLISKLTHEGYIHQPSAKRGRLMFVTCKTGLIGPDECPSMSQKCDIDHTSMSQKCDIEPISMSQKSDIEPSMSQNCDPMSHFCDPMSHFCDHKVKYKEKYKETAAAVEGAQEGLTTGYELYRKYYPTYPLHLYNEELLRAVESNLDVFEEMLLVWVGRQYKEQNIKGMLGLFERMVKERAPKPDLFCDACRDTSGHVKNEKGDWVRCKH